MSVRKYTAFFGGAFKSQLIYRSATIASIFSAVLGLIIQVSLWRALIGTGVRQDTTLPQMIAYVLINTAMLTLTASRFASDLGASVRDGSIIMHFLRPASFQLELLSTMLGKNIYRLLTVALPVAIVGGLLFGIPLPPSLPHALLFLALAAAGVMIMFQMIFIVGLLAFWMQATWYLSWYLDAGVTFFGGTVVPLWFYPQFLNRLSVFMPFRYITFEAISCYLGKTTISGAIAALGIALVWWGILFGIGHLIWRRAQAKMTINGG